MRQTRHEHDRVVAIERVEDFKIDRPSSTAVGRPDVDARVVWQARRVQVVHSAVVHGVDQISGVVGCWNQPTTLVLDRCDAL